MPAGRTNEFRAVLDTNVLLSAFLSDRGVPAEVWEAARRGMFQSVTSGPLLDELERVLLEKFRVPRRTAHQQRERVARNAHVVPVRTTVMHFPRGHGDNLVLATTIDGQAQYLVTGDRKHLLPLGSFRGCQIVTPRQFANLLAYRF